MTVSPARREFIFELVAAESDEQAIDCARRAVTAGVSMRDIAADLASWDELRAESVQYVQVVP